MLETRKSLNLCQIRAYHRQHHGNPLTDPELTEQSTDVSLQNLNEILNRCMNGDSTAFRAVMEEYQSYAFAVAFRFLSDEEDAKDVVQDSFISVWKNFPRYNTAIKFTTWLYSIVTNRCYDKLRSGRTRNTTSIDDAGPSLLASLVSDQNPEREYFNAEIAQLVETLTEQLPSKQKMIFVLRDLQGLSIAEVCGVLQISEASVKTNLVYARRHLRERLKPYLSE